MWDTLQDWFMVVAIAALLWTFVPRGMRLSLSGVLRDGAAHGWQLLRMLPPLAWRGLSWLEPRARAAVTGVKPFDEPPPATEPLMSRSIEPDTSIDTGTTIPPEPARVRNLTDREITEKLAALKKADRWLLSANDIYAIVKGNRNDVLLWVREVRANESEPPAALTPIAERPTAAPFREL